jgi:ketosteroid isomerase-like protein
MPPVTPPRRGRFALVAGICGGLLIVAGVVVLVLFLTVWKSSGGGAGDPLALAEKYVSAMEKGDVEAYFDCFPPEYFSMQDNPLLEGMDIDIKGLLKTAFNMMDVKFKNLKLELESEKGDQASVVSTSGTLLIAVMGVEQETDLAEDPLEFEMVKQDGRWYLTNDPMPTAWGQEFNFNMD